MTIKENKIIKVPKKLINEILDIINSYNKSPKSKDPENKKEYYEKELFWDDIFGRIKIVDHQKKIRYLLNEKIDKLLSTYASDKESIIPLFKKIISENRFSSIIAVVYPDNQNTLDKLVKYIEKAEKENWYDFYKGNYLFELVEKYKNDETNKYYLETFFELVDEYDQYFKRWKKSKCDKLKPIINEVFNIYKNRTLEEDLYIYDKIPDYRYDVVEHIAKYHKNIIGKEYMLNLLLELYQENKISGENISKNILFYLKENYDDEYISLFIENVIYNKYYSIRDENWTYIYKNVNYERDKWRIREITFILKTLLPNLYRLGTEVKSNFIEDEVEKEYNILWDYIFKKNKDLKIENIDEMELNDFIFVRSLQIHSLWRFCVLYASVDENNDDIYRAFDTFFKGDPKVELIFYELSIEKKSKKESFYSEFNYKVFDTFEFSQKTLDYKKNLMKKYWLESPRW